VRSSTACRIALLHYFDLMRWCVPFLFFCIAGIAFADNTIVIERYKKMLAEKPVEGTALERLWKMHQESGQTAQIIKEYRDQQTFSAQLIAGHLLLRAGKKEDAEACFKAAGKLDPTSAMPHLALANLFTNEPSRAAEALEKAVILSPAPDILLQLGNTWLAANQTEKAVAAWERLASISPGDRAVHKQLAANYERLNLHEKAILHWHQLAADGPPAERAEAFQRIANIHQLRGDIDPAVQALESAIQLVAPGQWMREQLQTQLIRLCERARRLDDLEARWRKEAEANPRDLGAQMQMVTLNEKTGNPEGVREWLEKLVALTPQTLSHRLKLASTLAQMGRPEDAAKLLDKSPAKLAAQIETIFLRAEIDIQLERIDDASKRIEALVARESANDGVRLSALQFYERHRIFSMQETYLRRTAAKGGESLIDLARFLFSQKKEADGKAALQQYVDASATAKQQAAALIRTSSLLTDAGDLNSAIFNLRQADELTPKDPETQRLLATLLVRSDDFAGAKKTLRYLQEIAPGEASDQLLFNFLARGVGQSLTALSDKLRAPTNQPAGVLSSIPLREESNQLLAAAESQQTATAWLRAARWSHWMREHPEALRRITQAVAKEPASSDALDFRATAEAAVGDRVTAIQSLNALVKMDPTRSSDATRRIAQLQLEASLPDDAIRTLAAFETAHPGDLDATMALASAQERTSRWSDALGTWERAFQSAPRARRREILPSLLRALQRLELNDRAAMVLLEALDSESDPKLRESLLNDLFSIATRTRKLPWLADELESRQRRQPLDFFLASARSRLLKMQGRNDEAFTLLGDVALAAPEDAAILDQLVAEALESGNLEAALTAQKRLILALPSTDSAGLEKLAKLQETALDIDGAMKTWERLCLRFPRDPQPLRSAAGFAQRWGENDRAKTWLRKITELDSGNPETWADLARLEQPADALRSYDKVLANSTSDAADFSLCLPSRPPVERREIQENYLRTVAGRGGEANPKVVRALQDFWADGGTSLSITARLRLLAIRETSKLLHATDNKPALAAWLSKWDTLAGDPASPQRSEVLWAFYYAGDVRRVLDHLQRCTDAQPDNPSFRSAWMWLGLDMGEYAKVSAWLLDRQRSSDERDGFPLALQSALRNTMLKNNFFESMFPPDFDRLRPLLWQSAIALAQTSRIHEAVALTKRLLANSPSRQSEYAAQYADWLLIAGRPDDAREILRKTAKGRGDSFDHPVFQMIRSCWMLLPEPERAAFRDEILSSSDPATLHYGIASTLLYGLEKNVDLAHKSIEGLLRLRGLSAPNDLLNSPGASSRSWGFISAAGQQLIAWQLDSLAEFLWSKALADSTPIALESDATSQTIRDIRTRHFALQLLQNDPRSRDGRLAEWLHSAPLEDVQTLAMVLEQDAPGLQLIALQHLWRTEKQNPMFKRSLINCLRNLRDPMIVLPAFEEMITSVSNDADPRVSREERLFASDTAQQLGFPEKALEWLIQPPGEIPSDKQLLDRFALLAASLKRNGLIAQCMEQADTLEPLARLRFATALVDAGYHDEPAALLASIEFPGTESVRLVLAARLGDINRVRWLAGRMSGPAKAMAIAQALPFLKEQQLASEALRICGMAFHGDLDDESAFRITVGIASLLPENHPLIAHLRSRLLVLAGEDATRTAQALDAIASIPQSKETLHALLQNLWNDGRGPVPAGLKLAQFALMENDRAAATSVIHALLVRNEVTTQNFTMLADQADTAKMQDLALQCSGEAFRRSPADLSLLFRHARCLHANGKSDDAAELLRKNALRMVLETTSTQDFANAFFDINCTDDGMRLLEESCARPPRGSDWPLRIALVQRYITAGKITEARNLLRQALANPQATAGSALVALAVQQGGLHKLPPELDAVAATPGQRAEAWSAAVQHVLEKEGRAPALALSKAHPEIFLHNPGFEKIIQSMEKDAAPESPAASPQSL